MLAKQVVLSILRTSRLRISRKDEQADGSLSYSLHLSNSCNFSCHLKFEAPNYLDDLNSLLFTFFL